VVRIKTCITGLLLVTSIGYVTNSAAAATASPKTIPGGYTLLTNDAVGDDIAVKLGNLLFYVGDDPEHGKELWRTDGTVSGTRMVIDATPGRESTSFSNLHVAGGKVWFSSWRGGAWVSNGTPGGTKKISDTLVLEEAVNHPTRSDVALLVAAPRGTENSELYKSSGTATPPSLVGGTEIYPGVEASYPHHFVELDGYQYFIGYTAVGYRLMRTNGSTTEVVNELNQPTNFGYWTKPLRINDQIVIIDIFGVVWTWDNLSFNLEESWNFPSEAFEADDAVYATVVQSGENQLYRFDADGVVNLSTAVGEPINIRTGRTVVSGGVEHFFFTTTDSGTETSLWVIRQRGVIPEKLTTFPYFSYDFTVNGIEVAANNSRVYLSADAWPEGTVNYWVPMTGGEATRVAPQADDGAQRESGIPLKLVGGRLVSSYQDPIHGVVPVRISPVNRSQITVLASNTMPRSADSSPYGEFDHAVSGDTLFFTAYDAVHGIELWKYEQGAASAKLVKDIWEGAESARPSDLLAVNGKVYFNAWTQDHGFEPWVSDGTAAGTRMIVDANVDGDSWSRFEAVNDFVFIRADNSSGDHLLYRTDGTPSGLVSIASSPFGLQYNRIDFIGVHLGALYFKGTVDTRGGIFKATTNLARASEVLSLGTEFPDVDEIELLGNKFIFIWESDVATGLYAVDKSFGPSPVNLGMRSLEEGEFLGRVDGKLVYVAETDADVDSEILWQTDGRRAGTKLLKDIDPTSETYDDLEPLEINLGGKLLFLGRTTRGGLELWSTDATPAGTKVLREIGTGTRSGLTYDSVVVMAGSSAYFEAPNSSGSIVLWRTNGVASGTEIVPNGLSRVRVVEEFADSLVIAGVKGDTPARLYLQPLGS
jgi:ELWxxDGT repeat protein